MAGRGPAPKETHQRERDTRRRQADSVTVAVDGELRGPDLVEETGRADWDAMTVAWYDRWRRSPQAQLFEDTDWGRLIMLAPIVDAYFTLKPSAAALSEIRLNEERLGATYVDRLRAKIKIDRSEQPVAEVVQLRDASREDVRARLRGDK
jgi:hypothetical protein